MSGDTWATASSPAYEGRCQTLCIAASCRGTSCPGATGVPVIDQAVQALYRDGYLHNHARMWLASYVVNLRKIRTGARGRTGCTPICSTATSPATTFHGGGSLAPPAASPICSTQKMWRALRRRHAWRGAA